MSLNFFTPLHTKLREFRNLTPQTLVLYYHRVLPEITFDPFSLQVTAEIFRQHLAFLSQAYTIISLTDLATQLAAGRFAKRRQLVITFDDGYQDNYRYAFPLLKQYGVPATIFITTDLIEAQAVFWWEELVRVIFQATEQELTIHTSEPLRFVLTTDQERYHALYQLHKYLKHQHPTEISKMLQPFTTGLPPVIDVDLPVTWDQIREMRRAGMTFGAHTCSHPVLSQLSAAEADQEIRRSQQTLSAHLQEPITLFAYPYGEPGDFTEETIHILKQYHFQCACSAVFGTNSLTCNPFNIQRVVVRNWDGATLARKIAHVFRYQEWIL